jgi:hypothetical protein
MPRLKMWKVKGGKIEDEKLGRWEGGKVGLRPLEERFA